MAVHAIIGIQVVFCSLAGEWAVPCPPLSFLPREKQTALRFMSTTAVPTTYLHAQVHGTECNRHTIATVTLSHFNRTLTHRDRPEVEELLPAGFTIDYGFTANNSILLYVLAQLGTTVHCSRLSSSQFCHVATYRKRIYSPLARQLIDGVGHGRRLAGHRTRCVACRT